MTRTRTHIARADSFPVRRFTGRLDVVVNAALHDRASDGVIERYLARIGLDGSDHALPVLHGAHVRSIPYENLSVRLGREIRLDVGSLVAKMVDRRRGGYCFEQNTLCAAVLEGLGFTVTRCLGRVRLGDAVSPRPATHMALLVEDLLVDVGFGAANPLGPVPLDGEATYGPYTWRTERAVSPEGEAVWLVRLFDMPLYTFTDAPQHPVDYVAPNHLSSTHPQSIFTQNTIVQRWDENYTQVGLIGCDLTERLPDGAVEVTTVDPDELGDVLRDRFALDVDDDDVAHLSALT
ncbi:MAG: arylamine N-acetyltransferase family protein [Acidimicrobiia bacterium]